MARKKERDEKKTLEIKEYLRKLTLTDETKATVDEYFDKAYNTPSLRIVKIELPIEDQVIAFIKEEYQGIRTGSSKENYLEIPVWSDTWFVGETIMPIGNKELSFRKKRYPNGMVSIEYIHGNAERRDDFQFSGIPKMKKKTYFFFHDHDIKGYQQYDDISKIDWKRFEDDPESIPEKQRPTENQIRAKEVEDGMKEISNLVTPFVHKYLLITLDEFFNKDTYKLRNNFSNGSPMYLLWGKLKSFNTFLDETVQYLKYMVILNGIEPDEYDVLIEEIEEQRKRVATAFTVLKHHYNRYDNGEIKGVKLDKRNRPLIPFELGTSEMDYDPVLMKVSPSKHAMKYKDSNGPIQTAFNEMEKLLTPRPETLQEILTSPNKFTGYILRKGKLYPNLGEIERRKDLYKNYGDEIIELSIERLLLE